MKTHTLALALSSFLILLMPPGALAHSVWIEELPGGGLGVRFGEWGEEVEQSPGHLDSLLAVNGWTPGADGKLQPVTVEKKSDHFHLGGADAKKPAQAETNFTVMKRGDTPGRLPMFYARWWPADRAAGTPTMNLDLVPTGKPDEVCVYFRGKPLGKGIELKLQVPAKDGQALLTDDTGIVRLPPSENPGLYLLTLAKHSETLPGFRSGLGYEVTSHNAALSWRIVAK